MLAGKLKEAKGLRLILGYFGLFMIVEGLVTIFPLAILAFYRNEWECYLDFLVPGVGSMALGALIFLMTTAFRKKGKLQKNEDSLLLVLLWISALAIGALPFYLTQFPILNNNNDSINLGMSYTESFFEATSGYSTTGLTVIPQKVYLSGLDSSDYGWSHVFLFHRAIMQFVGGAGLVLLVASIISSKNNFKLFFAEGHNDRLLPNLGKNAKLIFGIYSGWIFVGSVALWLAGMTPFDAFCHATAALATGGFGTRADSLAYYSSNAYQSLSNGNLLYTGNGLAIEGITCLLMIAGQTNFVLHTLLLTGKIKELSRDIEIKTATFVIIVATIITTLVTYNEHVNYYDYLEDMSIWTSLRYNFFNVVSTVTTTGFTNFPSMAYLGHFTIFISIIIMSIGGGMGSTAGGLKQYRVALLAKEFSSSFKNRYSSERFLHTNTIVRMGQVKEIEADEVKEATDYSILYIAFTLLGAIALLCLKDVKDIINAEEAAYEWSSALSSAGITVIDFADYKASNGTIHYDALLWLLTTAMFLGRLEILPVFYALKRIFVTPIENIQKHLQKKKHSKSMEE